MVALGRETHDYKIIKNPFICNSNYQVRLSPDKDPRENHVDRTEHIFQAEGSNGNTYLINPTNDKMSYCIGKEPIADMISSDPVDYEIPKEVLNDKRTDGKEPHKKGLPLSYIQITTEEEGVEWYRKHYPKIPEDLLPIIARYHWGEPITKKGIKNERKKILRKAQKKGLQVLTRKDNKDNPFTIDFS